MNLNHSPAQTVWSRWDRVALGFSQFFFLFYFFFLFFLVVVMVGPKRAASLISGF